MTIQPKLAIDGKFTPLVYPIVMNGEIHFMSVKDLEDCFHVSIIETANGLMFQRELYGNYYEIVYTLTEGWNKNVEESIQSPVPPQIIDGVWYVPIDFTLNSLFYRSVWMASLNIEYTKGAD